MPKWARAVAGERPRPGELLALLGAGLLAGAAWWRQIEGPWSWRVLVAAGRVVDVAAGCVSSFTASTQRFSAQRPRLRWAFIAARAHVVAIAFLLDAPPCPALRVWLATTLGASIGNVFRDSVVVGGAVLGAGRWFTSGRGLPRSLEAVSLLCFVKVAFATRHHDA